MSDLDTTATRQKCCLYYLRPGMGPEYDKRHEAVWPEILRLIGNSGIYDYSIFRRGELVVSVFRAPVRTPGAVRLGRNVQDRWTESMAGIFEQTSDDQGEPFWAERIFRFDR